MTNTKQRVCLVPGNMQNVKKPMDMLFDESLTNFSCKSERFAKLAEDLNICIFLENEHSIKKLLVA